jgi:hypothetical protein
MTPHTATYTNDRADAGTTYDADGRPRVTGTLETTYDAVGLPASAHDTGTRDVFAAGMTVEQGHDGDGQRVRHAENGYRTYYVRSSVTGAVAVEYDAAGQWRRGCVYAPGVGLVATRAFATGQYVEWVHSDPVTGSRRRTDTSGAEKAEAAEELDPLGVDMGRCNPSSGGCGGSLEDFGGKGGLLSQSRYGNAPDRRAGCSIQGMGVMCDLLVALISGGAAHECPDGDCGPRAGADGKLHPLTTDPRTGQLGYWAEGRGEDPPDGKWTDPETGEVFPTTGTNTNRVWVTTTYIGFSRGPSPQRKEEALDNPKKITEKGRNCNISLDFTGKWDDYDSPNGPSFSHFRRGEAYGVGFTATVTVSGGYRGALV